MTLTLRHVVLGLAAAATLAACNRDGEDKAVASAPVPGAVVTPA